MTAVRQAVCEACGARMRADRRDKCLRCGAVLAAGRAGPSATTETGPHAVADARSGRAWLVLGGGLALVLVAVAVALSRTAAEADAPSPQPGAPAEASAPPTTRSDRAPAPDGGTAVSRPVADQPVNPSLDPVTAASRVADSDPVEAERLLRSIVEKDPRSLEAHTNLGLLLVRAGRASEAVPYLAVAARVEPTRWLYRFNHAQALGAAGHWAAAIEEYRAAADLSPSDYPTRFNLAMALWRAGDAAAAVTAFEAALALDKTHAPAHLVLGQALERLGRVNAAVDAYDRYLELAPLASDADAVKRRIARLKSQPAAPAS